MGEKQRARREREAYKEGERAYDAGMPRSACPYKCGAWGLGWSWVHGWSHAMAMAVETQALLPLEAR